MVQALNQFLCGMTLSFGSNVILLAHLAMNVGMLSAPNVCTNVRKYACKEPFKEPLKYLFKRPLGHLKRPLKGSFKGPLKEAMYENFYVRKWLRLVG